MKTFLALACSAAFSITSAFAEEPAKLNPQKTFFQRVFGPDGIAVKGSRQTETSAKATAPATWALFPTDSLPAGKMVNEADATKLTEGSYADQTTYLLGQFVVTAAGESRAILRAKDKDVPMRIVAEYPSAAAAPAQGTAVTLDRSSGALVWRVQRAGDGSLNVFIRSIAQP